MLTRREALLTQASSGAFAPTIRIKGRGLV